MPPLDEPTAPPKLNILALPSHTAILFALIAAVVFGAAFATMLPGSRLWWPPIVFGLTLLPLRDFLHRPDRLQDKHELEEHQDETTETIEQELTSLAALAHQVEAPTGAASSPVQQSPVVSPAKLLTTPRAQAMESFGTFRRHYLGMGRNVAAALSKGLRNPPGRDRDRFRAMLAHELAHFLNKDVHLVWLSYGLLKMLALVMAVNLWVGLALSAFIIEVGPEVLRPEFWANLTQRLSALAPGLPVPDLVPVLTSLTQQKPELAAQLADPARQWANWETFFLYLAGAQWPFVLAGLVLLIVFWPRLLDVREMYADARAASLLGDSSLIPEAVKLHAFHATVWEAPGTSLRQRMEVWLVWLDGLLARVPLAPRALALDEDMGRERCESLKDPIAAFGPWRRIAIATGLAVVLLDLILRSTLAAAYISEPGAHLPFLVAFIAFSTWLLPRVCSGQDSPNRPSVRLVIQLVAVFTAIKLIPHILDALLGTFMVQTAPGSFGELLDAWAYSLAGASGGQLPPLLGVEITWGQFLMLHVVRPILYYMLLMPPILIGLLWLDIRLKQRALLWYRLGVRANRTFGLVTGGLAVGLALVIIPILNHLIFPEIYGSWSPLALVEMVIGVLALGTGLLVFLRYDRALRCLCPGCPKHVQGDYRLGRKCENCGTELHPWLVATYQATVPLNC